MPDQTETPAPAEKKEAKESAAVVRAQRDALMAIMRTADPDFNLDDMLDDILTDRHGELVYRPVNPPASAPAEDATASDTATVEAEAAGHPSAMDPDQPSTGAPPRQEMSSTLRLLAGGGQAQAEKKLDPASMTPGEFLKNKDALYRQAHST